MVKWARRFFVALLVLVGSAAAIAVVFAGPIAKWLLERHDEEWTGRQITAGKVSINLFTGEVDMADLVGFELSRQDTFLYIGHAYADLELTRFVRGDYDVAEVGLERLFVSIEQNGSAFNFDDLIERFSGTTPPDETGEEASRYRLENLHIDSAGVRYRETAIGSHLALHHIMATCPLIAWDDPDHHYEWTAQLASGGAISSTFDLNLDSLRYNLLARLDEVQISPLTPYALDILDIGTFEGLLSLDLELVGDFDTPTEVALRGRQSVRDFRLVNSARDTLISVASLSLAVDSLNTPAGIYDFGVLEADGAALKFEMYPGTDNFTMLLRDTSSVAAETGSSASGPDESNPFRLLISYAEDIINAYVMQNYSVDSVVVTRGTFVYNDHTLDEPFYFRLDSLDLRSGALNSQHSDLNFNAHSRLNRTGTMDAALSFDPHNLENMEIVYGIRNVRISSFSPYSTHYVAHPFQDGLIYYNSETKIFNRIIDSKNRLEVRKIDVGKKIGRKPVYNLPLRLAVAILRDVDGNIDLEIPVEGDLNDPEYRLGKVIWGIVENLLVKAATSPFRMLARAIDADEDDLKAVAFDYLSDSLTNRQRRNLTMLGRVLKIKPELRVNLEYLPGNSDELEMLAAFEAKKRYILKIDTLSEDEPNDAQLREIEALSLNDTAFVDYLNRRLLFEGSLATIEKCKRYVGRRRLANRMAAIVANRKRLVADYLVTEQQLPPEAFVILDDPDRVSDGIPKFEVKFDVYE